MSWPRVLVCNAGTIRVFRVAEELNRHGLLGCCATSLYFAPDLFKWFPAALRKRMERATVNRRCAALAGKVRTHAYPEIVHLLATAFGLGEPADWIQWRNCKFGNWVARNCLDDIDLIWSFDTSSLEIFEAAQERGIPCILDVSIAHPKLGMQIFREQAKQRPEYAPDLDDHVSEAHLERRIREIELADCLVAGSSFVAQSLAAEGIPVNKIKVNPYGVDLDLFAGKKQRSFEKPTVFLFVGWFSQRKGIYYLLEAWESSKMWQSGAKLRLVGGSRKDLCCWQGDLPPNVEILGRIPHKQLPGIYGQADVFVFPSLFEGFAKVVLEAMASGLPVITTAHACDTLTVIDGENGFIVEPGDVVRLGAAMKKLDMDRTLKIKMSSKASLASRRYSWRLYGERCRDICLQVASS